MLLRTAFKASSARWASVKTSARWASVGNTGSASVIVSDLNSAATMGSGTLDVFATPSLVALMENAACNAVIDSLAAGETTVGTKIDTSHLAATVFGAKVTAQATVTAVEGKRIEFTVRPPPTVMTLKG